ncbi:MAG TPA: C-GCAxxG-C-C family (seleno)protein [Bacillota bacterium]|nr:C-GCAxxG-C-C family (seleno)protein [Bacillota bacterium]
MNEDRAVDARNKAGNYFKEGYNCAEAIFLTYREYLAPEMDPSMVKLMTGFGGGLGHSGCMCGALTGAVTALNMLKGRETNRGSREEAYQLAKEFDERFEEKFGASCCRILNPHPFGSPEQKTNCLKVIGNTSRLLMEFLDEKGLVEQV